MNTNEIIVKLNRLYIVEFESKPTKIRFYCKKTNLEISIIDIAQAIQNIVELYNDSFIFLPDYREKQYREERFKLVLFFLDMYLEYNYKVHKGLNNNIIL